MGNSFRPPSIYGNIPPFPFHLQLGTFASIDLSRTVDKKNYVESLTVLYTIDLSTCEVNFDRFIDRDGDVYTVIFTLRDGSTFLEYSINITETDFIQLFKHTWPNSGISTKSNQTVDARGVITRTVVHSYGSGNKGGIVVLEMEKNSSCGDKEYSEVTVAHYFTHCGGTAFNRSKMDIGLSLVVKFQPSFGNLVMTVVGLEKHPVSALFFMFDEVKRTGIWKTTMCPHCARNESGRMFWQSEGEGSDSSSTPQLHGSRINASMMDNDGLFMGNGNGGFIQHAHFNVFQ